MKLRRSRWNSGKAEAAIDAIVSDAVDIFDPVPYWPMHPLDDERLMGTGLYVGAGGLLWGIRHLHAEGYSNEHPELFAELPFMIERNQVQQKFHEIDTTSYLHFDLPLLMLSYRVNDDADMLDAISDRLHQAESSQFFGLMMGVAGNMIAAIHMHESTGCSMKNSRMTPVWGL